MMILIGITWTQHAIYKHLDATRYDQQLDATSHGRHLHLVPTCYKKRLDTTRCDCTCTPVTITQLPIVYEYFYIRLLPVPESWCPGNEVPRSVIHSWVEFGSLRCLVALPLTPCSPMGLIRSYRDVRLVRSVPMSIHRLVTVRLSDDNCVVCTLCEGILKHAKRQVHTLCIYTT